MPERPTDMPKLTIATFNVNGINTRLANLLEWLERESPDRSPYDHQ
jgi:hypothetical protein